MPARLPSFNTIFCTMLCTRSRAVEKRGHQSAFTYLSCWYNSSAPMASTDARVLLPTSELIVFFMACLEAGQNDITDLHTQDKFNADVLGRPTLVASNGVLDSVVKSISSLTPVVQSSRS